MKVTCKVCPESFTVDPSRRDSGVFGEMEHFTRHWSSPSHIRNLSEKRNHYNALVGAHVLEGTEGLLSLAHVLHASAVISERQFGNKEVSRTNKPDAPPGYYDGAHRYRGRCFPNRLDNE
eukprot:10076387-Karenia_brevis.AAC.1